MIEDVIEFTVALEIDKLDIYVTLVTHTRTSPRAPTWLGPAPPPGAAAVVEVFPPFPPNTPHFEILLSPYT